MDPFSIIIGYGFGFMFFGALLWLYRLDKYGLSFLLSMFAIPILVMSFMALLFIFYFAAKLFAFVSLSLWWVCLIILVPLSIKAISYIYCQQHQKPKSKWDLLIESHSLKNSGLINKIFFTAKSNIEKTEDIFGEIIFVSTKRWLFAFFYCVLILFICFIIDSKLSPFDSQKLDLISNLSNPLEFHIRKELISFWFYFVLNDEEWLFNLIGFTALITICTALCWVHFRYLNWHAKRLHAALQEFSSDLEKNNQYLIWYGKTHGETEVLNIEDKLRWQKDHYFVKSKKYGVGFWLSADHSFEDF